MSVSVKSCTACGQLNPAINEFCPSCGADISSAFQRSISWTAAATLPPTAAAIAPERRRRSFARPDTRGAGFVWIGFIAAFFPVLFNIEPRIGLSVWGGGIATVVLGFVLMRKDQHTLARAGLFTNALAVLTLTVIGLKVYSTGDDPGASRSIAALATTPAASSVADWTTVTPTTNPSPIANVAMFRGNPEHTGELSGPGITGRPFRVWRFDTAGELYSSPAVVDGIVYIGSKSGYLFALNAENGNEQWRLELGDFIVRSSPAVIGDKIFVGAGNSLFGLKQRDGESIWESRIAYSSSATPTYRDGVIYVASQSSAVYAFDATTGRQKWMYQTDGPVFAAPSVSEEYVFFGTDSGKVLAISVKSGQPKWRFQTEGGVFSSPAVSDDLIYVTSKGGKIYALDADSGDERWSYDAGGEASPAISGGIVYVAGADGGLYALDAKRGGDPLWLFPTGSLITTSPVVANGIVYVASGSTLYAINATTGMEEWRYAAAYRIETSPVVVNGRVLIGGRDGFLDSIGGDGTTE